MDTPTPAQGDTTATAEPVQDTTSAPRRSLPVRLLRGFGIGVIVTSLLALPLVVVAGLWLAQVLAEIEPQLRLIRTDASFVVKASDGTVLGYESVYQGSNLQAHEIPPVVRDAVIAIEDRRFYDHGGIDYRGILRAGLANMRAGAIVQGGSTITQQLAKLLFLTSERTWERKVQETVLALWLEHHLSKDEILTRYLNTAYFGAGAYGIDAAAHRYFNSAVQDLTLAEAAMLAGMVRAPSVYSPFANAELARERTRVVLNAMADSGIISPTLAVSTSTVPAEPRRRVPGSPDGAYFNDFVVRQANARLRTYGGDFTVQTTLDPVLQRLANDIVAHHLNDEATARGAHQAALVAMRPDGAVLAMVGGRNYEESQFNRATQARRQPGSLFKVFVYLSALAQGWQPDDLVFDGPVRVGQWRPSNYGGGYRGEMTLTAAFAKSVNSVAVRLQEQVGRQSVIATARQLGLNSDLRPHPSMALGTFETTLLDITGAFAAIAADRTGIEPYAIVDIENADGMVYRRRAPRASQSLGPARRDMLHLLHSTTDWGTAQRAGAIGTRSFGKTGTSQDHRDAWFVGFAGDIVVGVWIGNDENTPMDGITGGALPAELWASFMARYQRMQGVGAPTNSDSIDRPAPPPSTRMILATTGRRLERVFPQADEQKADTPLGTNALMAAEAQRLRASLGQDTQVAAPQAAPPEAPPQQGPAVVTGPARVLTTAHLRVGGRDVTLRGIIGEVGEHAARMQRVLEGATVRCRVAADGMGSCTVNGADLARAAVRQGSAWARSSADDALRTAEREARQAGLGIWEPLNQPTTPAAAPSTPVGLATPGAPPPLTPPAGPQERTPFSEPPRSAPALLPVTPSDTQALNAPAGERSSALAGL